MQIYDIIIFNNRFINTSEYLMRKIFNSKTLIRILSISLIAILLIPCLASCKARPMAQTKLAKTEVGKVGEYSVLYEELYFLASSYCDAVKSQYKNDPEGLEAAVWEYVEENIVANYAILELCASEGLVYNEKELKGDVEDYIEKLIDQEFDGSRSDYLESHKLIGVTDHYVRFVTGVDILYDRLATKYKESGVVPNTDQELIYYIQNNFAHTWHIAILVDGDDTYEGEYAKALEALNKLKTGTTTMYKLIGSTYNEDVNMDTLTDTYGHYFPRGVMTKEYENAAFALDTKEISDIIHSTATNAKGQTVECFYIIQRLANDEDEIKLNLNALSDSAHEALIAERMEAVKATLSFTPNAYARSLDITNLEPTSNGADYILILIIVACVIGCALIVTSLIIIRRVRIKRFHQKLKARKK